MEWGRQECHPSGQHGILSHGGRSFLTAPLVSAHFGGGWCGVEGRNTLAKILPACRLPHVPTIHREKGFAFYFYAEEGSEPPHVHADKGDGTVKFWLQPVRLAYAENLKVAELRATEKIVENHQTKFLEKWHEFFDHKS